MKLLIGGDLVPTKATEELFVQKNVERLFGDILPFAATADRCMVNLECALTDRDTPIRKIGPNLKGRPGCADALREAGITDVFLSNNHVLDYGVEGLRDTVRELERVGIGYTGIGENDEDSRRTYTVEQDGKRVTFVNVCEHEYTYALPDCMGANPYDPYLTMHDIREAKRQADFVIVIYHGGKEHCAYPSARLVRLAHEMVECGASLVLMQHSHCIGCLEEYEGTPILYGQGNFHFVGYTVNTDAWRRGLLAEVDIQDTLTLTLHPVVANEYGIELAKGEERKTILDLLAEQSAHMKDGSWLTRFREFCHGDLPYRAAVAHAYTEGANEVDNELFAHYLDCEAHTDVWRELFRTWHKTLR